MGPSFPLQRAAASGAYMLADPPTGTGGDPAPAPGNPTRAQRIPGRVGDADNVNEFSYYVGQLILDKY